MSYISTSDFNFASDGYIRTNDFDFSLSKTSTGDGALTANDPAFASTIRIIRKVSGELGITKPFIQDQIGDQIVDENGNLLIGYEYQEAEVAARVQWGSNILGSMDAGPATVNAVAHVVRIASGDLNANDAIVTSDTSVIRNALADLTANKAIVVSTDTITRTLEIELNAATATINASVSINDAVVGNLKGNICQIAGNVRVIRNKAYGQMVANATRIDAITSDGITHITGDLQADTATLSSTDTITRKTNVDLDANAANITASVAINNEIAHQLQASDSQIVGSTALIRKANGSLIALPAYTTGSGSDGINHASGDLKADTATLSSTDTITRNLDYELNANAAEINASVSINSEIAHQLQANDTQIAGSVRLIRKADGSLIASAADISNAIDDGVIHAFGDLLANNAYLTSIGDRPLYLSDIPKIVDAVWSDRRALTVAKYLGLK